MPDSNLLAIRTKVRHLTRSPSPSQITNAQINDYINKFAMYDMPQHVKLFTDKVKFTFFTEPYVDEYSSNNTATELDNFKNKYLGFEAPVYIGGELVPYCQNRDDFFAAYPQTNRLTFITNGDGATMTFTGTLSSTPVVQGQTLFSSVDANNNTLALYDDNALSATTGTLSGTGTGVINYVTGVYNITFTAAPASGTAINSQTLTYLPARPQSILYFNNKFTVRPVPDQAYRVEINAFKRPTEILAGEEPELEQWADYIAFGAAIKILYDRIDLDTIAQLMPGFKEQELLVNRRNVNQQSRNKIKTMFNSGVYLNRSPFRRW